MITNANMINFKSFKDISQLIFLSMEPRSRIEMSCTQVNPKEGNKEKRGVAEGQADNDETFI